MSTLRDTAQDLLRSLRERPDELMLDVGAGGELLLARVRALVSALLVLLPLLNHVAGGVPAETLAGLTGVIAANVFAQLWLHLAKQRRRHRWLPFVTSGFDVSLVSLVLVLLAGIDPSAGLNSMVVFAAYLLAILATALRNDGRVTLATGLIAMLQYALLAGALLLGTEPGVLYSTQYGTVDLASQLQRLVLLAAGTLVTAVIVFRMQHLVSLSGNDGLTGLPNRSFLVHRVPQLLEAAREENRSITLALIDLDNFRRFNEDYGHRVGDRALIHAVECLGHASGDGEPMLRVGGEEFVLLLSRPMGAAWEHVESLRRQLASTPFPANPNEPPVRMTLSAGLACCPVDADDLSGLMRCADQRVRAAKRGGRDRVIARDEPNAG